MARTAGTAYVQVCRQVLGWRTCPPGGPPFKHPSPTQESWGRKGAVCPSLTSVNYHQESHYSEGRPSC